MAYDGGSVTCGCITSRTVWPWLANAALVGVPSLARISRLRHRRPGTSTGGEVALAAARLRKAAAQPKVSSTVRPAKYAS